MEARRRILTAMRPEGAVAVERALGRYAEIVPAYTFDEAMKRLETEHDFNLVLCGMYFAQTRMFDLLRTAKEKYPGVPFLCCRIGESEIPQVTLEAVGIAAKSMGAQDFINLPLLRPDPAADQDFRSLVLRYLR